MSKARCERCKYYAKLKAPYHYEKDGYKDGVTVYGFCTKNAKLFSFYPVYIPDGGVCKDFCGMLDGTQKPQTEPVEGQMTLFQEEN